MTNGDALRPGALVARHDRLVHALTVGDGVVSTAPGVRSATAPMSMDAVANLR